MRSSAKAKLEIAQKHLNAWLEAELEVTTNQSYTIGSRSLTRADLRDIRKQIEYWQNRVDALETIIRHGGRSRIFRGVPRDL